VNLEFDFRLQPAEAIEYLRVKGIRQSFRYDEMMHEAHHRAFTVAGVMRDDLLLDLRDSLIRARESGMAFSDWKKQIRPTLRRYGWWGRTEIVDPRTGEVRTIRVGARRLRTIYHTNMRVANAVARYQKLKALPFSRYWMYVSALLPTTRESHRLRHGTVLHRDDPWWRTNYPPNAWNCKCTVRAYSESELKRRKIPVTRTAPESIASPEWAYDIGAGWRLGSLRSVEAQGAIASLPLFIPDPKLDEKDPDALKKLFYSILGVKAGEGFVDATQNLLMIDDRLFGESGLKITKRHRHRFIKAMAQTIKDPDEIWLETEIQGERYHSGRKKRYRLSKKFFKFYRDASGKTFAVMAVFRYDEDKTAGSSVYVLDSLSQINKRRKDTRIF
jgi:SPP1 gp7 family putative phage head morphogenesis protein